jgi:Zn-dependent protease
MDILVYIIPILFAITVHEVAHGWVAWKCGDNTAKSLGRLTLNPIPHIDMFGTIIMPAMLYMSGSPFLLGYAKPVPINYNNLKNQKYDLYKVSLAGPASNFIMAIMWAIVLVYMSESGSYMEKMASIGVFFNVLLGIFNLLPIPPLDGAVFIRNMLPRSIVGLYDRYEGLGFFLLIVLLFMGLFKTVVLPLTIYYINKISVLFQEPITTTVLNNIV